MTDQAAARAFPFTDPVSGREVKLLVGGAFGSGVEHPDCDQLALVTPALDNFYCTHCRWNGRISGAWYMDVLRAKKSAGAPAAVEGNESPGAVVDARADEDHAAAGAPADTKTCDELLHQGHVCVVGAEVVE